VRLVACLIASTGRPQFRVGIPYVDTSAIIVDDKTKHLSGPVHSPLQCLLLVFEITRIAVGRTCAGTISIASGSASEIIPILNH
jgi:hypothetical protein